MKRRPYLNAYSTYEYTIKTYKSQGKIGYVIFTNWGGEFCFSAKYRNESQALEVAYDYAKYLFSKTST